MNCLAGIPEFHDPFAENSTAAAVGSSLILDGKKGELINVSASDKLVAEKKKAAAALRTHSQAEKRRRERINGHLATLRTLIPGTTKMDKATLLAEAITHLKELENNATEATKGLLLPLHSDEIIVEETITDAVDGDSSSSSFIKASICCDFNNEILTDLKQSFNSLQLKLVRVEIGTFGGRMKSTFVMSKLKHRGEEGDDEGFRPRKCVLSSVRCAMRSVIDSFSASQEFNLLSNKRQRVSVFSSVDSFPGGGFW